MSNLINSAGRLLNQLNNASTRQSSQIFKSKKINSHSYLTNLLPKRFLVTQSCSSHHLLNLFSQSSTLSAISHRSALSVISHRNYKTGISENYDEKFETARQQFRESSATVYVDPRGVFANNELDLNDVEIYGFDYDYTLAVYKKSLQKLVYDLGRDVLVKSYKYPRDIYDLDLNPTFAIRGLHYDVQNGLLMKIDAFHQIQLSSVYRGLTKVSDQEVRETYRGLYIPQSLIRATEGEDLRMKQLNDLFSVPEICLLSNVTEYFMKNNISYNPEILFYDVQNAVQSIHPIMHEMLDERVISQYLEKQSDLSEFLNRLKSAGKKLFLITNSPFKFVDCGMKYMIGSDWRQLFDIIIVQARKPKFFTTQTRPFRLYSQNNDSQLWIKVTKLVNHQIYMEGTVNQLLEMTGWEGSRILYFGDQIYSDLADLTLNYGWRTGAIICELENEISTLNSEEFQNEVSSLLAMQHLFDFAQKTGESDEVLDKLMFQRDLMRLRTKSLFNLQFGSIFRTHHNPTYFSRRLFRYSDIYTSHVTNLLNYSIKHVFSPRRGLLPHESKVSYILN